MTPPSFNGGDWLNYGEKSYGETYTAAIEATGLEYQTLRNSSWVAGQFELSQRRDNLTFYHHAEVACLPPAEADALLATFPSKIRLPRR